jgi:hypothetical protein
MTHQDMYSYFQNFNTQETENGMEHFCNSIGRKDVAGIDLDKLDAFFTTVSDIYIDTMENGLVSIDWENIVFESECTTRFFITGLRCVANAAIYLNIDIILEFLLSLERQDSELSCHELFEMTLVKKIIPFISRQGKESVQEYLGMVGQFGSHRIRPDQYRKFDKYLQDQYWAPANPITQ